MLTGNSNIARAWISACLCLGLVTVGVARADPDPGQDPKSDADDVVAEEMHTLGSPQEPSELLRRIQERKTERESLFPVAPLGWLRKATNEAEKDIYDLTRIQLGTQLTHVFQQLTDTIPKTDSFGTASTFDLIGAWHLLFPDTPQMGQAVAHLQGRWDYGTTGPEELGSFSLGSAIGTADTFSAYKPAFLLRNLYWRQGSPEAGWMFRFGKITPDGMLASSTHLASETTFLPSGGTGPFAIALPDSGLGVVGAWYFNDRLGVAGLLSDANADRFNWGDLSEGDLFAAAEVHVRLFRPRANRVGFSKVTFWRTDGTQDGEAANGSLGPRGWGFYLQHEQELTSDGRAIGIMRYGKSYNNSAVYDQQFAMHFLLYEPELLRVLKNDLIGIAYNWANTGISGTRSESNFEVFYRFPMFPGVDTSLSAQLIYHPALTREVDIAAAFSFRIRTSF